ncbi:hypothetical protein F210042A8_39120 [Blautia parvula]
MFYPIPLIITNYVDKKELSNSYTSQNKKKATGRVAHSPHMRYNIYAKIKTQRAAGPHRPGR